MSIVTLLKLIVIIVHFALHIIYLLLSRIEEKLDAKSLWSLLVSLRCEIPPNVKRVPLQFNGWLICCDGLDEWSFQSCMMYRDRPNTSNGNQVLI